MKIMETESGKLAEASAPADWSGSLQSAVSQKVRFSFLNTFNLLCGIAAVLCFIGALISWRMISGKPKPVRLD